MQHVCPCLTLHCIHIVAFNHGCAGTAHAKGDEATTSMKDAQELLKRLSIAAEVLVPRTSPDDTGKVR